MYKNHSHKTAMKHLQETADIHKEVNWYEIISFSYMPEAISQFSINNVLLLKKCQSENNTIVLETLQLIGPAAQHDGQHCTPSPQLWD